MIADVLVLEKLEAAVEDGERRATTRAEHVRWSTVRALLDTLRSDHPEKEEDGWTGSGISRTLL